MLGGSALVAMWNLTSNSNLKTSSSETCKHQSDWGEQCLPIWGMGQGLEGVHEGLQGRGTVK